MNGPRVILPRPCPICGEEFTPERRQIVRVPNPCCSRKCAAIQTAKPLKGRPIVAAIAARKANAKARIEALTKQHFGSLSAREIRIFNFAQREGWTRGFNTAMGRYRQRGAA